MTTRRELSQGLARLLDGLGRTDREVAATLASAGVKGRPHDRQACALARFLNATTAFDPAVARVTLTPVAVVVRRRPWWRRSIVVRVPPAVRVFLAHFDRSAYADLVT